MTWSRAGGLGPKFFFGNTMFADISKIPAVEKGEIPFTCHLIALL
jgi:hypothetical protein